MSKRKRVGPEKVRKPLSADKKAAREFAKSVWECWDVGVTEDGPFTVPTEEWNREELTALVAFAHRLLGAPRPVADDCQHEWSASTAAPANPPLPAVVCVKCGKCVGATPPAPVTQGDTPEEFVVRCPRKNLESVRFAVQRNKLTFSVVDTLAEALNLIRARRADGWPTGKYRVMQKISILAADYEDCTADALRRDS